MSPALWAALAGTGFAGGILCAIAGCRPQTAPVRPPHPLPRRLLARGSGRGTGPVRLGLGALAGVLAWLFTGWVVLAVVVPLAAVGLPLVLGGSHRAREQVDRLEAIEEWVRGLAGRISVGVTLEQALAAGAATAPAAIKPEVGRLVQRLRQGQSAPVALRSLAEDLACFTGDQVAAQLLLAYRRRGPGLAQALGQLADWVAEEVANLRLIEADRARPRFTARAVTVVAVGALVLLAFNDGYMDPYAAAAGQAVLALVLGVFGAALMWMRHITDASPAVRLFTPALRSSARTGAQR